MSSDEDETILELCKELKIKIPPKKPKSLTHNSIHPISNLENLDLNNLPNILILDNNENTIASDLVAQTSQQILAHDNLNITTENVITTLEEVDQSALIITEEVIETSMIQEPEEMLEKQTRVVSLEEMSSENVPDLTTVTDGLIDNEQNLIQDVDNVEVNENEKSTNNEYFGDLNSKRKRKSKGQVKSDNKREWTKNKCKKLRLEGESYMGYRRDSKQEKFQVLHDVMRPAREIGPRCFSEFCKKSKLRGCNNIAETERQEIFIIFWKQMDWSQRQQYVVSNVECGNRKQIKKIDSASRRNLSKQYFLNTESQGRVQVCMKTFLSTLGITENSVRYWIEHSEKGMTRKHGGTRPLQEKRSKDCMISLNKFFDDLPKMPSHYCRASSTKLYLEPVVQSKLKLYKLYCEKCNEQQEKPASRWLFDQTFNKKNLSLFSPKKDQCRVANDPVVTDIRALLYEPEGLIKYKLRYDDDYVLLPKRPKPRSNLPKPKLYQSRIPISQIKYNHLQELKRVIPSDCHSYYDSLPHK
ncbi:unnamed protein product, partial [Brenthis ino]